jgi:hypothetical protein
MYSDFAELKFVGVGVISPSRSTVGVRLVVRNVNFDGRLRCPT